MRFTRFWELPIFAIDKIEEEEVGLIEFRKSL